MKKKLAFFLILFQLCIFPVQSIMADAPLWLRWCTISPDGEHIAFTYSGDIYIVPVSGGQARQLTANTSYDYAPVWSPDGKQLAFCGTREGSKDVFLTSIEGGQPKRLTTHSGNEIPVAFLDSKTVLFSAALTPSVNNMQFPSNTYHQTYKVSTEGGRPELYMEWPMGNPSLGKKGILFENIKGYEDVWRKHHTSSITRDIWLYDGKSYSQITNFKGEDRNPVWASDNNSFYYLSEQDGSFNVYHRELKSGKETQLTFHKDNPVRFLSLSNSGVLCYSFNGELYTLNPGSKPQKVNISITRDEMSRSVVRKILGSGATEVSISPKNKEIAFILNGDVYVTSTDYSTTRQITDTPERERTLDFSPDGRSIVYDSERGGVWQIYQTTLVDKEDKNFVYASSFKEERLTDGKYTAFQPSYNPKGGEVAFLKNRTEISILNLKSKKVRTAMDAKYQYSYIDGDQTYTWSPDGKWLLTEYIGTGGWNNSDVALVKADGSGEIHNLTNSGYVEGNPKWVLGGKAMIFTSDRAGYRSHGSWGSQCDAYIMFFDRKAYNRFCMNKEEVALFDEKEKIEKEEKEKAEKDKKKDKKDKKEDKKADQEDDKPLTFDLSHLEEWTVRLTPYSTSMGDYILNKDGNKLYYIAPHAGSLALWEQDLKEHSNTLKVPRMGWVDFNVDADCKNAYMASYGIIKKLELASGKVSTIDFRAFNNERPAEKRAYYFEHIWRQTKEKLYDPGMNGADWDKIHTTYSRFLPHVCNNYDFAEMASEMLGELNVSHTGCRFGGYGGALPTASLGAFFCSDYKGDGLKIQEVMVGSPLEHAEKEVKPGAIIKAIDGVSIKAGMDYFPLLEGKTGKYTRLSIESGKEKFDVIVKPVSQGAESQLLYKRWVKRNRDIVDKISGGRLAYVHIEAMDAESFMTLYKDLMSDSNRNRDAVIVDTRHNGGGWLHGDVCILLSGERTMQYKPRGQFIGNDPFDRWLKPSCMLVCEDNYSNAHGTPWNYKELGLGKLIGTAVPGTMTAVWWERLDGGLVFGIPQVGAYDNNGDVLENQLLTPDIEVHNAPSDVLHGKDAQLEKAIAEMLKK